eukprot:TRINITY_DN4964_c0_g1_i4.p1 TRINITY_DN4964_c0_g1~~TRINITY_DN4964_c0_g1_i4.p1  ORF type:complete len:119 (+),score=36.42 TRINITY_DN4964_c0_g1_i4:171-527(+)
MEKVDLVLMGAEGVVENGGIINLIGSYQIAMVAKALNKPFYVSAESYKFVRLFPLTQNELESSSTSGSQPFTDVQSPIQVMNPVCDYTPPAYITLLFTDLGILTPAAISDELIKLYYS